MYSSFDIAFLPREVGRITCLQSEVRRASIRSTSRDDRAVMNSLAVLRSCSAENILGDIM